MTLPVERYEGAGDDWDELVARTPGSTFCHRHDWRLVMEAAFGHECIWLVARAPDGGLEGVLPLVRVKSRLFGHYLVSMPFLNYGGPLGSGHAVAALVAHATALAEADKVKLLELRSRAELPLALAASHRKITVVLDLATSSEALIKQFPSKLRSQVRRPFKEGFEVCHGSDQVEPFYRVFARHMRDLGTPVMPRGFFERIAEVFGDDAWFGCGYLGGQPVSAGAGFVWQGEFEMTWASSLAEHNRISANMGLYWSFMERCIEAGITRFNFGRCTPGGGTHRFKRQWGASDEQLWWYQRSTTDGEAATPSPDSGALAWGPRVWKRLPLGLANWLGPRIVRGIP